jgi:hypothetical protein
LEGQRETSESLLLHCRRRLAHSFRFVSIGERVRHEAAREDTTSAKLRGAEIIIVTIITCAFSKVWNLVSGDVIDDGILVSWWRRKNGTPLKKWNHRASE